MKKILSQNKLGRRGGCVCTRQLYWFTHQYKGKNQNWIDLGRLGQTWIDLDRLGQTWIHLDVLGYTWMYLDVLGCTWIQLIIVILIMNLFRIQRYIIVIS